MDPNDAHPAWGQQQNHLVPPLSLQLDVENNFLPANLPGHPAMGFNHDNGYDLWQFAPPSAEELVELARQAHPGPLMPSHPNHGPPVLANPPPMIVPSPHQHVSRKILYMDISPKPCLKNPFRGHIKNYPEEV